MTWSSQLRKHAPVLTALLLVALVLRWWQISESLWLDELHTAWTVSGPVSEIAERARIGNQSPLFFYVVRISMTFLGWSEWSLRFPSLIAGLTALPLAYYVAMTWTRSRTCAALVAALVAVDSRSIFLAQEARPYALVQLLGALHVFVFWRVQRAPQRGTRVALVVTGALLFWTHYTSALLFLGELIWYILTVSATRYRPKQLLSDGFLLVLFMLPASSHLAEIMSRRAAWAEFVQQRPPTAVWTWFSLDALVAFPLLLIGIAGLISALRRDTLLQRPTVWSAVSLVALWFVVPIGTAWALTAMDITRLFFPRYIIATSLSTFLAAGIVLSLIRGQRLRRVLAVVVIAVAVAEGGMWRQFLADGRLHNDRVQNWREAVAALAEEWSRSPKPVLLRSGLLEAVQIDRNIPDLMRRYYLLPLTSLYRLPDSAELLPIDNAGTMNERLASTCKLTGGAWLVAAGSRKTREAVVGKVVSALGEPCRIGEARVFGNVEVVEMVCGE